MPTLGSHTLLRVILPAKGVEVEPMSRTHHAYHPLTPLVHESVKSDVSPSAGKPPH